MSDFLKNFLPPKAKHAILGTVIRFLWGVRCGALLVRLLAVIISSHNRREISSRTAGVVILAFGRTIFNDDISALSEYAKKHQLPYCFLSFPSYLRALLSESLWPQEMRTQIAFYSVRHIHAAFLARITSVFERTLSILANEYHVKVGIVLAGQIDYAMDYPWIAAIKNFGGKFIVLNKESIIYSSSFAQETVDLYKKDSFFYEGDAVLLYNAFAKELYMRAGAIEEKNSYVVGCPRVDRLIQIGAKGRSKNRFVLLAAFLDPTYRAEKLWREVLVTLYADPFLRSRITIKCRDTREIPVVKKDFPDFNVVTGPIEKFLEMNPAVFVGFNSTACLDALIAEIPLVVPWWAEALAMEGESLLGPPTSDFHALVHTPEELGRILRMRLADGVADAPSVSWRTNVRMRNFIEEKYSFLDGKNCERFFAFIDECGITSAPAKAA